MAVPVIVLIEDNDGDALLVEKALTVAKIPYRLERFQNGVDAVAVLCARKPRAVPDAILMDLNTPGSNAFDVLDRFRNTEHLARVPVSIFTSSRSRQDKLAAQERGARFVEKPSHLNEFFAAVQTTIKEMLAVNERAG